MKKSIVAAAALLAGIAIAAPDLGWSADDVTKTGEAETSGQGMPGMDRSMMGGAGMMGGPREQGEMGRMHRFGDMRERMMRRMMHGAPQQRCEEHMAQRAAMIAYTVTKLKLTAEQKPLWDKLDTTLQAAREKQQQLCDALKPSGEQRQVTVLDRVDRAEQRLSARLDTLHQIRPVLQQLYQVLTPEQKAMIDHGFRRS